MAIYIIIGIIAITLIAIWLGNQNKKRIKEEQEEQKEIIKKAIQEAQKEKDDK